MEQNNPIARSSDPHTSHTAADYMTDSGKRKRLTEIAWMVVDKFPNSTYQELFSASKAYFAYLGMENPFSSADALMKRLNDARAVGMIENGRERTCQKSGLECSTWNRTSRREPLPKSKPKPSVNVWGLDVAYYRKTLQGILASLDNQEPKNLAIALDRVRASLPDQESVAELKRQLGRYAPGEGDLEVSLGWTGDDSVGIPSFALAWALPIDQLDEYMDREAIRTELHSLTCHFGDGADRVIFSDECPTCMRLKSDPIPSSGCPDCHLDRPAPAEHGGEA